MYYIIPYVLIYTGPYRVNAAMGPRIQAQVLEAAERELVIYLMALVMPSRVPKCHQYHSLPGPQVYDNHQLWTQQ